LLRRAHPASHAAAQAALRAWDARLAARERELDAREAALFALSRQPDAALLDTITDTSTRGGRLRGLLAHAGEWTVRNGALFAKVLREEQEWTVRGGDVYARVGGAPAHEEKGAPDVGDDRERKEPSSPMALALAAAATPTVTTPARLSFLAKCRCEGLVAKVPPRSSVHDAAYSGLSALAGIAVLAALQAGPVGEQHRIQLVASFGASAVLLFAAPSSPLAQPRNLVVGNVVSSFLGVCVALAFNGAAPWLAPAVAVAVAITVMALLGCTHPPGGAIAMIAVIGGRTVTDQGFMYVLLPATTGSLLLLLIALLTNNVHPSRRYPLWW
jgi:hypothetical protein